MFICMCKHIYIRVYRKGLAVEALGEEETLGREEFLQNEKGLTWFSGNKEEGNKV